MIWLHDHMTTWLHFTWWHDDMMTGGFADNWPYGIFIVYGPLFHYCYFVSRQNRIYVESIDKEINYLLDTKIILIDGRSDMLLQQILIVNVNSSQQARNEINWYNVGKLGISSEQFNSSILF